ncbi:hypothetical protein [Yoonia sp. 208BN28-4]|uniref:hypothetical protein n=1 Tax=Yoonia sp. 208BN28-4 TaxID=3126505 RepID=UPI0030B6BD29
MTDLAAITPHLKQGESVLWSGKPSAPDSLRAYGGWHRWVGRLFIFIAIVMCLIAWANRAEIGNASVYIGLVGVPLLIGLAFSVGLSWLQRDARRSMEYAVTSKRVLVVTKTGPIAFPVTKTSAIKHIPGKDGTDTVQFMAGHNRKVTARSANNSIIQRQVYSQAKAFRLPPDEAADAFRALQTLQAKST